MSTTSIEAQGVTVDEAIQIALNKLGVTRDRVEIEIVYHPRSGFLGIGARRAKVRATMREGFMENGEEYDMSTADTPGRSRRRRRSSRRGRNRSIGKAKGDRTGQEGGRRDGFPKRDRRGGGGRSEPEKARAASGSAARRDEPAGRKRVATASETTAALEEQAGAAAQHGNERPAREDIQTRATEVVCELMRLMGFESEVAGGFDERASEILVQVHAEAEGLLIGRRGQTLDAIEHLVNRMVTRGESSPEYWIMVDIGGYRERRRDALLELADRLKVRAITQSCAVQVNPMSPRDRRVFQGALGGDGTVETRVLGSGFYRRVQIVPAGLAGEVTSGEENASNANRAVGSSHREDGR